MSEIIITGGNYRNKDISFFDDGNDYIVRGGNFSRDVPVTINSTIVVDSGNPNFENVILPNVVRVGGKGKFCTYDFCYWRHLEGTDNPKNLPVEPEECRHAVLPGDEVIIDGVSKTIYEREEVIEWY